MKPLIVAATEEEIAPSIDFLVRRQIPYLITGVGMTATGYRLGKFLTDFCPDYILNVGIAGAISKKIPIGSVVRIAVDAISELGAEDNEDFISIEELGFGTNTFRSDVPPQLCVTLPAYEAITVNTVHGNENSIQNIKERFPNAFIETMEGAAVLFVSKEENIPCMQIRAVSNYVEKRDRSRWNIPLAVENLNTWLQEFLLQSGA